MHHVIVRIQVKPDAIDAFLAATRDNHEHTLRESGCRRYDVLRANDDACKFMLDEAYDDEAAFKAHQQTPHYHRWRTVVEPFMAAPRVGERWSTVLPDRAQAAPR